MLVDTSANDKPKFAGVKILIVILGIKKRIFHFIHVNSFTSPLLVL